VAKSGLPYEEWLAHWRERQINGVSTVTYFKIRRDDKKERKRKKVLNNEAVIRVEDLPQTKFL